MLLVLKQKLKENQKEILTIFSFCFMIGMISHGYFFFNNSLSHDSLNEFYNPSSFAWKISLGRFFVPVYKLITSPFFSIPLICGLLGLIWLSTSTFIICKTFKITSKSLQFFISALLITNLTNTAQIATYIHDFDGNMFALLLSTIIVYILIYHRSRFIYTIPLIVIVLAIYQAYLAVILTLISLYILLELFNKKKIIDLLEFIIKTIISLFFGGILYFISLKIVLFLTNINISTGGSNTLDKISLSLSTYLNNTFDIYFKTLYKFAFPISSYSMKLSSLVNAILLFAFLIISILIILKKCYGLPEKALAIVLYISLPVFMNISSVFAGWGHDLMQYAMWLIYIIIILICTSDYITINKYIKYFTILLISFVIWNNILVANMVYIKKDYEKDANLSLFTRVIYSMENIENYIPGQTPVVFIGRPSSAIDRMNGFEQYYGIIGSNNQLTIGAGLLSYYQNYFEYVLEVPINFVDQQTWNYFNSIDFNVPSYPDKDAIFFQDNILVVNFDD